MTLLDRHLVPQGLWEHPMKLHFGGQVSPNPVDPPPIDQLHLHSLAIRKCIDIVMFLSAPNNRCVFTSLLLLLHGSFQANKSLLTVIFWGKIFKIRIRACARKMCKFDQ